MAFSALPSFSTGDILTAATMEQVADNFDASDVALVTTKGDLTPASGNQALVRLAVGGNGSRLEAASGQAGGMKWQVPFYGRITRTANQSIGNNSLTTIIFNESDIFDPSNIHDPTTNNTRWTAPAAGFYMAIGTARFAASTGGTQRYVVLTKNGTEIARASLNATPSNTQVALTVVTAINMATSDYFELKVLQDSGGSLNVVDAVFCFSLLGTFGT